MPFLGVEPVQEFASVAKQTITGTGATAYSLDHSVASANDLAVFVNNVRQEPTSAYTASGGTITFTSALASTDSCYVMYIARTFSSATAEANSVGITELNVSDGTSGQALTTNGSGTLSFSTISSSTPTLDAVTGAGATTTNAITVGAFTSTGIDDNATSTAVTIDSSQNTTFAGKVTATNAVLEGAPDNILILRSTDDGPLYMEFERGTDRHAYLGFGGSNDQFKINNEESGGTIQLLTANTAAVTIDSSQNTTIAGNLIAGDGTDISMGTLSPGQVKVDGNGYNGAITLDGTAMYVYHNSSSRDLIFGTNETERVRINGSTGDVKISNQLYFGSNLGDVISLYDDRLGDANMYGFGVESSALFSRSVSLFNWYVNQTNNGSSYAMQLNGNGRLTLKGSQNSANAAQVYFIDDGSPGLVGGIEFTGTSGNGGGYHSSLQTSGELQYSAAGHFFADTSVVSSGIPGFWCRMNGDMTIGTYGNFSSVLTEYLFDVSTGHLHIDGTLYQNSSSTNSDSKMKENVVTLTNCLNKVSQLRGVEFDWKDEYVREAYHDVGLIAQEVESVIPEVVSQHEIGVGKKAGTGETLKSVDYSRLTAVLIEAVKELKTQNEALETRIATLESN